MINFTEGTTLSEYIDGALLKADYNEDDGVFEYLFGFMINGKEYFDAPVVPDTQKEQHAVFMSSFDVARRTLQKIYARSGIVAPNWADATADAAGFLSVN